MVDLTKREAALTLLSTYLAYRKWYIKFVYEKRDGTGASLMGALAGDKDYFATLNDGTGKFGPDFFAEQDEIRAKATHRVELTTEPMADEVLLRVLDYFGWDIMEFAKGKVLSGMIIGTKDFVDSCREISDDEKGESVAPKGVKPQLKHDTFIDEHGTLLYWN